MMGTSDTLTFSWAASLSWTVTPRDTNPFGYSYLRVTTLEYLSVYFPEQEITIALASAPNARRLTSYDVNHDGWKMEISSRGP